MLLLSGVLTGSVFSVASLKQNVMCLVCLINLICLLLMHQIQFSFTFTDATQTHNSLKVFVLNDEQESVSPYLVQVQ